MCISQIQQTFIFQICHNYSAEDRRDVRVPTQILVCTVQPQSWKYTVKYLCSEFLENSMSSVAKIFNSLGGIFGGSFYTKIDLLAIIFILLVYDYTNIQSQTCSLEYRFRALENVTRVMFTPTVQHLL